MSQATHSIKINRSSSHRSEMDANVIAPTGPLAQGREFVWTNADFARVQGLIYKRAGISLHDGKHAMVYSRLSRRLRETGHDSFSDYLSWLESNDGPEWQEFVNALTTNLTAFSASSIISKYSRLTCVASRRELPGRYGAMPLLRVRSPIQ